MDEDLSVFPPSHPLRIYLRGLDLDDADNFSGVDGDQDTRACASIAPSYLSSLTSGYVFLFDLLSYYYNLIIYFPKRHLLQCLVQSKHIFTNDRAYLEQCKSDLERQLSSCPLRPLSFVPISFAILPIFLALLFSNVSILIYCAGILSFLLITAKLMFIFLIVSLVKYAISFMEDLHLTFRKSVTLLHGLNTVEIGYMLASRGGAFRNQLDRVVLPKYSSQLYDALFVYVSNVSSLSRTINQIIQSSPSLVSSLVEVGSSLSISHENVTDGEANRKSLLNIKAMFCVALEFDSELARVFGCFVALHFHESIILNCPVRVINALCVWLWCLLRGRGHLRDVDQMRVNLEERGGFGDEPPSGVTKVSSPAFEEVQVREHLSALASLHYNVISLSCRLHKLRERVAAKAHSVGLFELSYEDLQSMRILLTNCQYCLDEAEKTLQVESPKTAVPIPVPNVPESTSIVEGMDKLIPLDSEQPPVEDECLEAIAGADDPQARGEEGLYDDFDHLGQPVSKAEMKKRNADRAILLTELTSVIAHRMVETREREAKALSRSRGLLDSNQSPLPPSSPPPDVDERQSMPIPNDECDIPLEEAPRGLSPDMKKRLLLRGRNFHLVRTAEVLPTQAQSDGTPRLLDVGNPEENGGVIATEALTETSIRHSTISADLKALILQRGQAVRSSKEEEIFDDVGSGEELNAEELEEC